MKPTAKKARRLALPLLLAGVLGLSAAVAARISLGGTASLGAGTAAVSSCTADLDVAAEPVIDDTIDTTTGAYLVNAIRVTATDPAASNASASLAACDGQTYIIDILGKATPAAATTVLRNLTGTFEHAALATGLTLSPALDPATIERISIVIKGTSATTETTVPQTTVAPTTTVPAPVPSTCADGLNTMGYPYAFALTVDGPNRLFGAGTTDDLSACNGKRFEITVTGDSGATVHVYGGPSFTYSSLVLLWDPIVTTWTTNGVSQTIPAEYAGEMTFTTPGSWTNPTIAFYES